MNNTVGIVIVLYNPELPLLLHNLRSIRLYDISVVLVDNSSTSIEDRLPNEVRHKVIYIPLLKNIGISAAQNIGIKELKKTNVEFVIFYDQDSVITKDLIAAMPILYNEIERICPKLFLLGPTIIDKDDPKANNRFIQGKTDSHQFGFCLRDVIISSGSCVKMSKIEEIGYLDESLFIDSVDFEWCWRANSIGFVSGTTNQLVLEHKVGQRNFNFPGGYRVIISSPSRYYYQYRNYLLLCKRDYVPFRWKIKVGIKYFLRLIYFPIALEDGREIVKYAFKGIKAGINSSNIGPDYGG